MDASSHGVTEPRRSELDRPSARRFRWRRRFVKLTVIAIATTAAWFIWRQGFGHPTAARELSRLLADVREPRLWQFRMQLNNRLPPRLQLPLEDLGNLYQRRWKAVQEMSTSDWPLAEVRPLILEMFAGDQFTREAAVSAFGRYAVEDEQIMRAWLGSFQLGLPFAHLGALRTVRKDAPYRHPIEVRIAPLTNSPDTRVRILTAETLERMDSAYRGITASIRLKCLEQQLSEPLPIPFLLEAVYDLGELGPAALVAVPLLTELTGHENEKLRWAATNALRKIQR